MSRSQTYNKIIHSTKWKKLSKELRERYPLCQVCGERLTQAVHHIDNLERYNNDPDEMYEKAFDLNNLLCVCNECHARLHREINFKRYATKDDKKKYNQDKTTDFLNDWLGINIEDKKDDKNNECPKSEQGRKKDK